VARTGVKLDGAPPAVDAPPPRLGEHTDAVLADLGLSPEEIAALRDKGAL
jgi:formyl-CoA transferase